jgi:NTE family protein
VLSPLKMELDPMAWAPASGRASEDLHTGPYLHEAVLTDSGVYDNMGLETAWKKYKTILVSNGGGKMQPQPDPASDWARHGLRINDIMDNQVRSLRVRQVIAAFESGERTGTYWGIRTCITDYKVADALPCPEDQTLALAATGDAIEAAGFCRAGAVDQLGLCGLRCGDAGACGEGCSSAGVSVSGEPRRVREAMNGPHN